MAQFFWTKLPLWTVLGLIFPACCGPKVTNLNLSTQPTSRVRSSPFPRGERAKESCMAAPALLKKAKKLDNKMAGCNISSIAFPYGLWHLGMVKPYGLREETMA